MNRPFDLRPKGATTAALPARRRGHSNLELVLFLGVLVSCLVGTRIDFQEGEAKGSVEPQAQDEALEQGVVEPQLTKEEQFRENHLTVMVKLQGSALANIDQLTPSQRAAHDAMATEDERLSFLVKLEIERITARGERLREGLGERGRELFGTLSELAAERRNSHIRKLKNTLLNEYRGSIERFGDEAGLDERRVKNAQKARARGRRVQWLADFEQARLREMRGSGARPAGMDQATYEQLIADEDPHSFLRGLNLSRLVPSSASGGSRDSEASESAGQATAGVEASNSSSAVSERDGSGAPASLQPDTQANTKPKARPGAVQDPQSESEPKDQKGKGRDTSAEAERKGVKVGSPTGEPGEKAVGSAGEKPTAQEGQRKESVGGQRTAQPERMTALESLEAAQKLGQVLDALPGGVREWADAIGGGVDAEQPQERLQQYIEKVAPLRELIADSGLTSELREQYRVDEIHDVHLVVTVLGSGGVDVQNDVLLLSQIAEAEQRNAQRAATESDSTAPGKGAERSAEASATRPSAAAEEQPSEETLSLSESRKAADNLARILDTVPAEASALAAALGGGVDSEDSEERFAGYRERASRLRELIKQSSLTQELREQLQIDRMQDEVLVVAVLGSGGVDVGRDVALLDQLAVAQPKPSASELSASELAEQPGVNATGEAATAQGIQPAGDELTEAGVSEGEPDAQAQAPKGESAADPSIAKLRLEAEKERKALLKQLRQLPSVASALAGHARFNADDLAKTSEMPLAEGLRERYSLAAERVVREALKAELMSLDLVDSILQYEPGYLPLTVLQAAGEDVGRELKRLRQLKARANAGGALKQAAGSGASEAQPVPQEETSPNAKAGSELGAAAAEPAAGNKQARTDAAGKQDPNGEAQRTPRPKPLAGLAVDDDSPDIELPLRSGKSQVGEGPSDRQASTSTQDRKRLSPKKQSEPRGKRPRNGGPSPKGQNPSEKPAPKEKPSAGKPKGSGRKDPGGPADGRL